MKLLFWMVMSIFGSYTAFAANTLVKLEANCVVPDHNDGKWECKEQLKVSLPEALRLYPLLLVHNTSLDYQSPSYSSIEVKEHKVDEPLLFNAKFEEDYSHYVGLFLKIGINKIEIRTADQTLVHSFDLELTVKNLY
jgi:hypothetical protein